MTLSPYPTIALAMGCPAGIAAELLAATLATEPFPGDIRLIAIGDTRLLAKGAAAAHCAPQARVLRPGETIPPEPGRYFLDLGHFNAEAMPSGEISLGAGKFAIATFAQAIDLGVAGIAEVVAWTPFNKAAMRLAHPSYEDEILYTAERLGFCGTASEFNILPGLWNARVTSHVPLGDVAPLITFGRVMKSLKLTDQAMRASGLAQPRIAVSGLNPHAGEGGNFGREEIDVLKPVVAAARRQGIECDGPFPPDTVFLRARSGEFDAVLTMYHDQGQIAMKLIGFDEGVTLLGGFPFPLLTPAHGSAYDIAYQGKARSGAMFNALTMAMRMARSRKQASAAPIKDSSAFC